MKTWINAFLKLNNRMLRDYDAYIHTCDLKQQIPLGKRNFLAFFLNELKAKICINFASIYEGDGMEEIGKFLWLKQRTANKWLNAKKGKLKRRTWIRVNSITSSFAAFVAHRKRKKRIFFLENLRREFSWSKYLEQSYIWHERWCEHNNYFGELCNVWRMNHQTGLDTSNS